MFSLLSLKNKFLNWLNLFYASHIACMSPFSTLTNILIINVYHRRSLELLNFMIAILVYDGRKVYKYCYFFSQRNVSFCHHFCIRRPSYQCEKPFVSNTRQNSEWTETSTCQNEIELAMFGEWHFFLNSPTNTK